MRVNTQRLLINLDKFFDWIPIFSTITNLVNAIIRRAISHKSQTEIKQNRYFTHLKSKEADGAVALIPIVGNAVVLYHRFMDKKRKELLKAIPINVNVLTMESDTIKNDKGFMTIALRLNPLTIIHAGKELKKDAGFMLEAIKNDPLAYKEAPYELTSNPNFVLEAVKANGLVLAHVKSHHLTPDIATAAIEQNFQALKHAGSYLSDEDVMFKAVQKHGVIVLNHTKLTSNPDFMLRVLKETKDRTALNYISPSNRGVSFMLQALKIVPTTINFAPQNLFSSKEFVLQALNMNVMTLDQVNKDLWLSFDFAMSRIKEDADAIKFVPEDRLLNDHYMKTALAANSDVIRYIPRNLLMSSRNLMSIIYSKHLDKLFLTRPELRSDSDFILYLLKEFQSVSTYVHPDLWKDQTFVIRAVKISVQNLQYAHPELKKDKAFMIVILGMNIQAISYMDKTLMQDAGFLISLVDSQILSITEVSQEFRNDISFMRQILKRRPIELKHAGPNVQDDEGIILEVVSQNPMLLEFAGPNAKKSHRIVNKAIEKQIEPLQYADATLRNDKNFMLSIIRKNGLALKFGLQDDEEAVLEAIAQNPRAINFASERIRNGIQKLEKLQAAVAERIEYLDQNNFRSFEYIRNLLDESRPLLAEKNTEKLESQLVKLKAAGRAALDIIENNRVLGQNAYFLGYVIGDFCNLVLLDKSDDQTKIEFLNQPKNLVTALKELENRTNTSQTAVDKTELVSLVDQFHLAVQKLPQLHEHIEVVTHLSKYIREDLQRKNPIYFITPFFEQFKNYKVDDRNDDALAIIEFANKLALEAGVLFNWGMGILKDDEDDDTSGTSFDYNFNYVTTPRKAKTVPNPQDEKILNDTLSRRIRGVLENSIKNHPNCSNVPFTDDELRKKVDAILAKTNLQNINKIVKEVAKELKKEHKASYSPNYSYNH